MWRKLYLPMFLLNMDLWLFWPWPSLPTMPKLSRVMGWPVVNWWPCMGGGAFRCSLNLSPNLICQTHCFEEPVAWNGEMSVTLWEVSVYYSVRLIGRFVCSKKMVEDFWDIYFSFIMVEGRVVDSNTNVFSSTLFAVLVLSWNATCWIRVVVEMLCL